MGVNHHRIADASRPQRIHAGLLWTCLLGGWVGLAHAGSGATGAPRPPSAAQAPPALPSQPQVVPQLPDCDQVLTRQLEQHDPRGPRQGPVCSAANVTRLAAQFPTFKVPPEGVSATEQATLQRKTDQEHDQALLACLKKYAEKTQCAEAACQIAALLRSLAERKGDPKSPPAYTKEELDYGTLCLSCASNTSATKSQRTLVEEWSVPPKRLKNDLYYGLGGALLGLGAVSMAVGIGFSTRHNQPNGDMNCMSGGLPSQCLNNFVPHILVTVGLGVAGGVAGGLLTWGGCVQCKEHAKEIPEMAPQQGVGP